MNIELRVAALSKLIANKSEAVEHRLSEEFRHVERTLLQGTDYDELSGALKILTVLAPRFHMAVLPLLTDFVRSIPSRALTENNHPIPPSWLRYKSAGHLIRNAIDAMKPIRYVHTEAATDFLLALAHSSESDVRSSAERTLEALAEFDLDIFYGERGLGAQPQARIVTHLTKLEDAQLTAKTDLILRILSQVLAPSMEGHSWSYNAVTISRGSIINKGGIADMRAEAIMLLKRMYPLQDAIDYRRSILSTLDIATRRERPITDPETAAMFERDTKAVLNFIQNLVATEALPLVQAIEHQAYWNYHHAASSCIEMTALAVRDALVKHSEYQIYKQLIGFEGIFGDWEQLRHSESSWDYTDTKRHEMARQYLDQIDDANYELWRGRILEFSTTRSNDLATFPVYYEFLQSLGREKPRLALELVTLHEVVMEPFFIALVSGLWTSTRQENIDSIVQSWITNGKHLTTIAKSLHKEGANRLPTLSAVATRSTELNDRNALVNVMGVAAILHTQGCLEAKVIFMRVMRELAGRNDASWVNVIWFNRDFRSLIESMDETEHAEVLICMKPLQKVSYQAEEILYILGERNPLPMLEYLIHRLRIEKKREAELREKGINISEDKDFESIPYHLDKLSQILAKIPENLLTALRQEFVEEDRQMFPYRGGARLVKTVFPILEGPIEAILFNFIESGHQIDINFALAVVLSYGSETSILQICKAIVKAVPEESSAWHELASAILSTGVVHGEYGMLHAFEDKLEAFSAWKDDNNPSVKFFAAWITEKLDHLIVQEQQRVEESLALRKYQYGVGKDDEV